MARIFCRSDKISEIGLFFVLTLLLILYGVREFTQAQSQEPAAAGDDAVAQWVAKQVKLAQEYQEKGDNDQARQIYAEISQKYPGTTYDLEARVLQAGLSISEGDTAEPNAVLEGLYADFSEHPELCTNIYSLANQYWGLKKYVEAKALYQYISRNSPESNLALKGRVWGDAGCEIELGNYSAAEQAINALKADYAGHEGLCTELYSLANEYWNLKEYGEAKALYQYVSQNTSDSNLALKGQAAVASCELGNDSAAELIDALKNDYSGHPNLFATIYDLADQYYRLQKYGEAKALYQYVSQNTSDIKLAHKGQIRVACCELRQGNDSAAEQ